MGRADCPPQGRHATSEALDTCSIFSSGHMQHLQLGTKDVKVVWPTPGGLRTVERAGRRKRARSPKVGRGAPEFAEKGSDSDDSRCYRHNLPWSTSLPTYAFLGMRGGGPLKGSIKGVSLCAISSPGSNARGHDPLGSATSARPAPRSGANCRPSNGADSVGAAIHGSGAKSSMWGARWRSGSWWVVPRQKSRVPRKSHKRVGARRASLGESGDRGVRPQHCSFGFWPAGAGVPPPADRPPPTHRLSGMGVSVLAEVAIDSLRASVLELLEVFQIGPAPPRERR